MSLVKSLISGTAVARVLFVTVAFGVGIDVSTVERVIHIGVPYTMEEFFQETGRAGRNGKPAQSVLYFNSYDISRGKKPLQNVVRENCTTQSCRREVILRHFGSSLSWQECGNQHNCCDNCKKLVSVTTVTNRKTLMKAKCNHLDHTPHRDSLVNR